MSHQTIIPSLPVTKTQIGPSSGWQDTFGFTEHFVVRNEDGRVEHAQLAFRGSLVMLGDLHGDMHDLPHRHGSISMTAESAEAGRRGLRPAPSPPASKVIQPLTDTDYGSHAFTVEDYEGNHWHLGTYDPLAFRNTRYWKTRAMIHQTIIPAFRANDAQALIDWLCDTFGFTQRMIVPDRNGGIAHAELEWRGSLVMLGSARDQVDSLNETIGRASISLTAESNEQVDELYRRVQVRGGDDPRPDGRHRLRIARVHGTRSRGQLLALRHLRPAGVGRLVMSLSPEPERPDIDSSYGVGDPQYPFTPIDWDDVAATGSPSRAAIGSPPRDPRAEPTPSRSGESGTTTRSGSLPFQRR